MKPSFSCCRAGIAWPEALREGRAGALRLDQSWLGAGQRDLSWIHDNIAYVPGSTPAYDRARCVRGARRRLPGLHPAWSHLLQGVEYPRSLRRRISPRHRGRASRNADGLLLLVRGMARRGMVDLRPSEPRIPHRARRRREGVGTRSTRQWSRRGATSIWCA